MHYLDHPFDYQTPEFASVYDELSLWASYFGQLLLKHFPFKANMNILDVGCANGFPSFELAHALGESCQITAVDVWSQALDRARSKQSFYGVQHIEFIQADAADLPFDVNSFDIIVSNLGINNFENPEKVLKECKRVMKASGKLIFTTNLKGHYQEFYAAFETTLRELNLTEFLPGLQANIDHRYSLKKLSTLLQNTGFQIERIIEDQFQWRYLNGSALLGHSLTRFGFLEGWRKVVPKTLERKVFDQLEARLNLIAQKQGELRMTVPMAYVEAKNG